MSLIKWLVVVLTIVSATTLYGQEINLSDSIRFESTSFRDADVSLDVQSNCEFIWGRGVKVAWVQKGGAVIYLFDIVSASSASLATIPGSNVTVNLSFDSQIGGELKLIRTVNGVEIELRITGGTAPIHTIYTVSQFETF